MTSGPVHRIECARAEDFLASLPDASVDLVATDPPYCGMKSDAWDNQWANDKEFIEWIGALAFQWARVLKPNGSLYCFASPTMGSLVELKIGESLRVLNRITWKKPLFSTKAEMFVKKDLRAFFPASEVIIFAEQFNSDNAVKGESSYIGKCDDLRGFVFEPLRAYLDEERERAGISRASVEQATGTQMSSHWFSRVQWALPTAKHYATMRALFNSIGGEYLRKDYEDLRKDYEDLRRPFSVSADVPYTDVWDFPTVNAYLGKHPCEKPATMAEHIIRASSREGGVVLDTFAGSGAFVGAAARLGRVAWGCDSSPEWAAKAKRTTETYQISLFGDIA